MYECDSKSKKRLAIKKIRKARNKKAIGKNYLRADPCSIFKKARYI